MLFQVVVWNASLGMIAQAKKKVSFHLALN